MAVNTQNFTGREFRFDWYDCVEEHTSNVEFDELLSYIFCPSYLGDDGKKENESCGFTKESESHYTLWCSGRTCCEGMLVELKMIKRQDLVAVLADIMRPSQDQIHFKVEVSKDSMDSFVFCVASKKTATKFFKEITDLVSLHGFRRL